MKHGILKRVIALCLAGGVMALTLAACGDSENMDEGEGTVQEVSQDAAREDEDGTVGVNENEDTVNADSSGNDVRVAHASSSGNSGNGFAIPVFKPGEEPDPGQELQPGEELQPGADSKPGAGTQSSTGSQSSTGAPSGAGTQKPQQPQPSAGTQQPQQPQQPSTGNPTAHTHNWVTKTIHHDATGHYESKVVGTEEGIIGRTPTYLIYRCECGQQFPYEEGIKNAAFQHAVSESFKKDEKGNLIPVPGHAIKEIVEGGDPIYGPIDIVEDVWVVDTAAWDETVTTCSICGAKQ